MLKKIAKVIYWVVVYTGCFLMGYGIGVAAQKLEEKVF